MESHTREGATARLDAARRTERSAASDLETARGSADELHAAVEFGAAERETGARSAWLAWVEEGEGD
jgi:hypothetical protein